MSVRKEYRDLTVGDIYRNGKSVPNAQSQRIMVRRTWFQER